MYHISNDKRVINSAQMICKGMMLCLNEKTLEKITVTDLYNKSYVSRATFYRLFDNMNDVLSYMCDKMIQDSLDIALDKQFQSSDDFFIFFIQNWIDNAELVRALAQNNVLNILYDTHMKHSKDIQNFFAVPELGELEMDYLISVLSSLIPAALNVWLMHSGNESAKEVLGYVKKTISILDKTL